MTLLSRLFSPHRASASESMTELTTEIAALKTRNDILETLVSRLCDERDLLHDYAVEIQDRYSDALQMLQAQEHAVSKRTRKPKTEPTVTVGSEDIPHG